MWKNIDKLNPDGGHYSVLSLRHGEGMKALRQLFPDAKADEMNLVLFSTSGVHGTYNTIEESESAINGDVDAFTEITFLVVHPRLVTLRYGVCNPINMNDIGFLKRLRESSHEYFSKIGLPG